MMPFAKHLRLFGAIKLRKRDVMPIAYVLLNVEAGAESEVLKAIRSIEGVKEAYAVYGVYDIIAKVETKSMDELKDIVTWHIRKIEKVRSTLTMITMEGFTKG